jgi:hypothetical protein
LEARKGRAGFLILVEPEKAGSEWEAEAGQIPKSIRSQAFILDEAEEETGELRKYGSQTGCWFNASCMNFDVVDSTLAEKSAGVVARG